MQVVDETTKTRGFQTIVPMRDGSLEPLCLPAGDRRSVLAGHPASDALRDYGSRRRRQD